LGKSTDFFTTVYKYKRKLNKCLGILTYKTGDYFDITWAFIEHNWAYSKELEEAVEDETEFYGEGEVKRTERYKLKE
jgi:hypothetical protein